MADTQTIGKLLVQLFLDDAGFTEDLKSAEDKIAGFAGSVGKAADAISNVFVTAMKAGTAAIVGFTAASAVVGAQFEQQVQTVAALKGITDKTSEAYVKITDKARELGASTAFSATAAAEAMQNLARSGQDVDTMIATIGPALNFAGAAGAELSQATDMLAASLAQFSLPASHAARVSDVYAVALKESLFATDSLAEAMKQAGPVGAAFGQELENVTAVVAQFKNLGLEGSTSGTIYKAMLAALAKPTKEAAEALAELGLTSEQVNPSLHDMTDILHTLANAGLGVDDALAIFGRRFGGSVAAVIEKTREGVGGMDDLLVKLQESAGQAGEMYETMQDTVTGQFAILKSAVEELMLTTFDTFKAPISDLLRELSSTVQAVAAEFGKRSGEIGKSLQENIGQAIDWLRSNRAVIVETFISGANAITSMAVALGGMLPLLDEIAAAMAVVFAVTMAQKLGVAISGLVSSLALLRGGFRAFMAEVVTATGGLFAFVLAIGALVAALGTLAIKYSEAEKAAKKLKQEQEAAAAVSEAAAQKLLADLGEEITKTKDLQAERRKALAAAGELTSIRKEELDLIRDATREELALAVARGQLVEHAGELRTVASLYEELEEDAVPAVTKRIKSLQEELGVLHSKAGGVARLHEELSKFDKVGAEATARAKGFAGGMDELAAAAGSFDEEIVRTELALKALTAENEDAQASLLQTYASALPEAIDTTTEAFKRLKDAADEAAEAAEKAWIEAASNAMASGAAVSKRALEGLQDTLANQRQALDLSHQRELSDLEDAHLAALKMVEGNLVARLVVEEQFAGARVKVLKRQVIEINRLELKAGMDALKAKKASFDKEVAARQSTKDAIASIESLSLKESERIELERVAFMIEHADMTANERLVAAEHFQGLIKVARDIESQDSATRGQLMVANAIQAASAVANATKAIFRSFTGAASKAYDTTKQVFTKLVGLAKKAADVSAQIFDALTGGAVSLDAFAMISDAMDAIASGDSSGSIGDVAAEFIQEMADNASVFVDGIVEALPAVIDALIGAMPGIIGKVVEAVPLILKMIIDAIPEIVSTVADQLPIIINAFVEALPEIVNALAEAIPELVTIVADNFPTIVQALVDALPTVITALADALPDLIQVLSDAIPDLVQAVADALPIIVDGIVEALPDIFDAIIAGLPILIKGLVDALPDLIMALLDGLLSLIPMLIEQLVVIIDAILELLPDIITAILEALPDIIRAILKAIPQIIDSILSALPEIIMAIIAAIPDIIISLVEEIPGMITHIVLAIVQAIPEIVSALIEGIFTELLPRIPEIVWTLIKELSIALWDLVSGLVEFIVDGIKSLFGFGDKDKESKYSGISYIPATMRGVTLHKGEAVLTADENQRRMFGGAAGASQSNPSVPVVTPGQGGGATLEALFAVDGRIVDGVLMRANANGKGSMMQTVKRMAGVQSGVPKGRFNSWR